jgi:hypothetical protein
MASVLPPGPEDEEMGKMMYKESTKDKVQSTKDKVRRTKDKGQGTEYKVQG